MRLTIHRSLPPDLGCRAGSFTPSERTTSPILRPTVATILAGVQLDRIAISAGEVLQVSGFYPFQYTHQFMQTGVSFGQRAPWYDQTTRLYRAFEFLTVKDRSSGTSPGGRIPGQINLNTIYDIEIFRALCDAQPGNQFAAADVDAMFYAMIASRSPGQTAASPVTQITGADRPFLGFGTGMLPQGDLQAQYSNGRTDHTHRLRNRH